MRILHLTRDFPPQNCGGLSTAVGGLVLATQKEGCEALVLSFDNYRPKKQASCQDTDVRKKTICPGVSCVRVSHEAAVSKAIELAIEFSAEIVHLHHEMLWEPAQQIAGSCDAPVVYSVHVLQSEQNRLRGMETTMSSDAQLRALEACGLIHVPSQTVSDALTENDPSLAGKISLVRLGTHHGEGKRASERWDDHSLSPDVKSDPPFLLYAGRFADINGMSELLQALPEIFARHPGLRAVVAGGMPNTLRVQKRWIARWRELAGPLYTRLEFVGWKSGEELQRLYCRASMLVVPSWYETFGQVALEGMANGTPLIVSSGGALSELADSTCAIVIPPQDIGAIVDAVDELLHAPKKTAIRAAKAKEIAMKYSWRQLTPNYVRMYHGLLSMSDDSEYPSQ